MTSRTFARAAAVAISGSSALIACSHRIPEPEAAAQPTSALTEAEYPPPPARVEFLPERPSNDAKWVKGEWLWSGRRWSWRAGMWVIPPVGVAFARPVLVRRSDGKLFFAPGTWRDAQGREVPAPAEVLAQSVPTGVVNPKGETEPTSADVHVDGGADAADAEAPLLP